MTLIQKTLIISVILISGCATNTDVENIQSQVDGLKIQVTQTQADISNALQQAQLADKAANNALGSALEAVKLTEESNQKATQYLSK